MGERAYGETFLLHLQEKDNIKTLAQNGSLAQNTTPKLHQNLLVD